MDSQDDEEEEEDDDENEFDEDEDDQNDMTWVEWFCSLPGHEFFCIVDEEFIDDAFNLTGLAAIVPHFSEALEMLQDIGPEGPYTKADLQRIEASAELLYALIHQRYIQSRQGITHLYDKYKSKIWGVCPRTLCERQPVLPIGLSDSPNQDTVKLFCPQCQDVYQPPSSRHQTIDGCAFGTTAAHLLIYSYPDFCRQMVNGWWPRLNNDRYEGMTRIQQSGIYHPRIYGFKVHHSSPAGPRMQWLRQKHLQPLTTPAITNTNHSNGI